MGKSKVEASKGVPSGWEEQTYRIWKPADIGDELTGTYGDSVTVSGGMNGDFKAHVIVTADGEPFQVAGAMLDRVFDKLTSGTAVMVRFEGMEDLEDGRRMRFFRVFTQKAPK